MNHYSYPYHMNYYQPQYLDHEELTNQLIQQPFYPHLKSKTLNLNTPMVENQRYEPFNPNGSWTINANSFIGDLILNIDSAGNVTGNVYNNPIQGGFFDFESQKIIFQRVLNPTIKDQNQIYEGYLFRPICQSENCMEFMAGTFIAFQGTAGTAKRNQFGWFAQRKRTN
ncbi:hypothetical protein [Bacillus cereus]|uniref:hypothetical protein n=1 Tax=Bacillus cereus TaxID=1396 RepID=UPI001075E8B8|nr:hypothetical protein [Bacillus cereus]TFZ14878.1 hypothetical protein C6Y54_00200 [Bacillus cereus]